MFEKEKFFFSTKIKSSHSGGLVVIYGATEENVHYSVYFVIKRVSETFLSPLQGAEYMTFHLLMFSLGNKRWKL